MFNAKLTMLVTLTLIFASCFDSSPVRLISAESRGVSRIFAKEGVRGGGRL